MEKLAEVPIYQQISYLTEIHMNSCIHFRNPNGIDPAMLELTHWPQYQHQTQQYIRFTSNLTSFPAESRYAASRVHFWNELFPALEKTCDKECETCESVSVNAGYVVTSIAALICSMIFLRGCIQ